MFGNKFAQGIHLINELSRLQQQFNVLDTAYGLAKAANDMDAANALLEEAKPVYTQIQHYKTHLPEYAARA